LKALEWGIVDVQEWVQNAITAKATKVTDRLIRQYTNYNPEKLSQAERESEIRAMTIKTAAERNAEFEEESK